MNLGTRLRGRSRNRWQDEVREDGRIFGGEGWQEKVYDREEWKKLLRTAGNRRILHTPIERMNEINVRSGVAPYLFINKCAQPSSYHPGILMLLSTYKTAPTIFLSISFCSTCRFGFYYISFIQSRKLTPNITSSTSSTCMKLYSSMKVR
jgi:hypothetical protein